MKAIKKDKTFDSVKMMREVRNRLVLKIKKMTF